MRMAWVNRSAVMRIACAPLKTCMMDKKLLETRKCLNHRLDASEHSHKTGTIHIISIIIADVFKCCDIVGEDIRHGLDTRARQPLYYLRFESRRVVHTHAMRPHHANSRIQTFAYTQNVYAFCVQTKQKYLACYFRIMEPTQYDDCASIGSSSALTKVYQVYDNINIYNSLFIYDDTSTSEEILELLKQKLIDQMYTVVDASDIEKEKEKEKEKETERENDSSPDHYDTYHTVIFLPVQDYNPELLDRYNVTVAFVHGVVAFSKLILAYPRAELPWIISL